MSGQAGFKAKEQEVDVQTALLSARDRPTDNADGSLPTRSCFHPNDGVVIFYDVIGLSAAGRAEEF